VPFHVVHKSGEGLAQCGSCRLQSTLGTHRPIVAAACRTPAPPQLSHSSRLRRDGRAAQRLVAQSVLWIAGEACATIFDLLQSSTRNDQQLLDQQASRTPKVSGIWPLISQPLDWRPGPRSTGSETSQQMTRLVLCWFEEVRHGVREAKNRRALLAPEGLQSPRARLLPLEWEKLPRDLRVSSAEDHSRFPPPPPPSTTTLSRFPRLRDHRRADPAPKCNWRMQAPAQAASRHRAEERPFPESQRVHDPTCTRVDGTRKGDEAPGFAPSA
jgi:hypothetical protein